jgi:hypothetical protein
MFSLNFRSKAYKGRYSTKDFKLWVSTIGKADYKKVYVLLHYNGKEKEFKDSIIEASVDSYTETFRKASKALAILEKGKNNYNKTEIISNIFQEEQTAISNHCITLLRDKESTFGSKPSLDEKVKKNLERLA